MLSSLTNVLGILRGGRLARMQHLREVSALAGEGRQKHRLPRYWTTLRRCNNVRRPGTSAASPVSVKAMCYGKQATTTFHELVSINPRPLIVHLFLPYTISQLSCNRAKYLAPPPQIKQAALRPRDGTLRLSNPSDNDRNISTNTHNSRPQQAPSLSQKWPPACPPVSHPQVSGPRTPTPAPLPPPPHPPLDPPIPLPTFPVPPSPLPPRLPTHPRRLAPPSRPPRSREHTPGSRNRFSRIRAPGPARRGRRPRSAIRAVGRRERGARARRRGAGALY